MSEPVYIINTGARTALGLHAAASAAALRAAISGNAKYPYWVDQTGAPVTLALDRELPPDLPCRQRMLALARSALAEACRPLQELSWPQPVPLWLGFPEPRPGFCVNDAHWVSHHLSGEPLIDSNNDSIKLALGGHSAVLTLLHQARQMMEQRHWLVCLVGGVDSYLQPDTLAWLDQHRQLAGPVSRSGFVPGEGAGFVLLMTAEAAREAGLEPLARLVNSAIGQETKRIKTQDINLGEGLTQTVRETLAPLTPGQHPVHEIYCDINGERYRGEEWGFTCLKLAHYFTDPTGYCSPADCWGDTGAASGALFATLATQAAQRGYASGPRSLLWASSEAGPRAGVLLETPYQPSPYRG